MMQVLSSDPELQLEVFTKQRDKALVKGGPDSPKVAMATLQLANLLCTRDGRLIMDPCERFPHELVVGTHPTNLGGGSVPHSAGTGCILSWPRRPRVSVNGRCRHSSRDGRVNYHRFRVRS
jgi:hypothetical protein